MGNTACVALSKNVLLCRDPSLVLEYEVFQEEDKKHDQWLEELDVGHEDLIGFPRSSQQLKLTDKHYYEDESETKLPWKSNICEQNIHTVEVTRAQKNNSNHATIIITEVDEFSQLKRKSAYKVENSLSSNSFGMSPIYRIKSQKIFNQSLLNLNDESFSPTRSLVKQKNNKQFTPKSSPSQTYKIRDSFIDFQRKRSKLQLKL